MCVNFVEIILFKPHLIAYGHLVSAVVTLGDSCILHFVAVFDNTEDFNDKRMSSRSLHDVMSFQRQSSATTPVPVANVHVSAELEDFMSKWDHTYCKKPPQARLRV